MSGSDSENENFCYFGTPLEPYDEDAFPKKKPISVEEQIATDAQGRRRFHGAFTGGFSAGFFNTVGSLEGWTPSEFKSTRQEKAQNVTQKPEDFMDEEDMGEFGIAHQTVRATSEYSTVKKRKRQIFMEGPIPGEPVLETLLTSGNETVGYLLLKNIGIQDKIVQQQEEVNEPERKVYGCEMPVAYKIPEKIENKQYQIPEIYKEFLTNPKSNTFGLGYQGLDKGHISLFRSSNLIMKDKNNKKVSISGQAFGVGAFEEEDEDIYIKDDMSNYDFELTKEKSSSRYEMNTADLLFGVFKHSKTPLIFKKLYSPPSIPHSFSGIHKVRKSRFEPVKEEPVPADRKDINPIIRARYLGENTEKTFTESKPIIEPVSEGNKANSIKDEAVSTKGFDISSVLISDRFVSASQKEDVNNILEAVQKNETLHGTQQMRDAARMKMFGPLTRLTTDWHPCAILCKRFNVPEPFLDKPNEGLRKKTKNLIFEYQKNAEVDSMFKPGLSVQLSDKTPTTSSAEIDDPPDMSNSNPITDLVQENTQTSSNSTLEEKLKTESPPKDVTEKIDIAEKLDLFKAVFLSSSESEDEDKNEDEKDEINRTEELKTNVLSEQLLPKIKPMKEGILSNVNFHHFFKSNDSIQVDGTDTQRENPQDQLTVISSSIKEESREAKGKDLMEVLSYGPKLPNKKVEITSEITVADDDSENEWVEKSTDKKKRAKHKKKHKKEKHKKHKHEKKSRTEA